MLKRVMTVLLSSPMLIRLVVTTALAGAGGCASEISPTLSEISPTPPMLGRIAVLPPSDATGRPLSEVRGGTDGHDAPSQSLATLLAVEAGQQFARYGFDVVDPALVASATRHHLQPLPIVSQLSAEGDRR
jgi:hypothetical protein